MAFFIVVIFIGNCLYQRSNGKWGAIKVVPLAQAYSGVTLLPSLERFNKLNESLSRTLGGSGGGSGSRGRGRGRGQSLSPFRGFKSVTPLDEPDEEKLEF